MATDAPSAVEEDAPQHAPPFRHDGDVAFQEGEEPEPGRKASLPEPIEKLASGRKVSSEEAAEALAWFLEDDYNEAPDEFATRTLTVNIGPDPDNPKNVKWVIRSLNEDIIKELRRQATSGNRASRRDGTGEFDGSKFNHLVVVEASLDPDLRQVAASVGVADPVYVLKHRLQKKPLLVAQIAEHVLTLSGGDDQDVQEARMVRAAGNS